MVRVRAIVRRRKYFSIAPEVMAAQGAVHPYLRLVEDEQWCELGVNVFSE